ncbi:MAG: hypothetical protein Q9218_006160 [Villophora microphyllina]
MLSFQDDSDNRAQGFLACVTITTTVALVLISLRFYVRLGIVRKHGADDYTIFPAMICAILALSFNGLLVSQGFGKHMHHLMPQQQKRMRIWNFVLYIPILFGLALSKISVGLLLLRLLGTAASKAQKLLLHLIIYFIAAYTLIELVNVLTICRPLAMLWTRGLHGTCRSFSSVNAIGYFHGASSAAVAFSLSAMPVIFFWKLQMKRLTKIITCLLMGFGIFDGVCAIMRTVLLYTYAESQDVSYTSIPTTIWGNLELTFAIIAACIPTLRPLFRYFDGSRLRTSFTRRQGYINQDQVRNQPLPSPHYRAASAGTTGLDLTTFKSSDLHHPYGREPDLDSDAKTIRKTINIEMVA